MKQTIIYLLGITILFGGCSFFKKKNETLLYSTKCDVERIQGDYIIGTDNIRFSGVELTSNEFSFSGTTALLFHGNNQEGFNNSLPVLNKNLVKISAWRKKCVNCGTFTVKEASWDKVKLLSYRIVEEHNGWEKIQAHHQVSSSISGRQTIITSYVNQKNNKAVVDDFEVKVYSHQKYPDYPTLPQLDIRVDKEDMKTLLAYTIEAKKLGVLTQKHKKKFPATLKIGQKSFALKIRLKGDWPDHVTDDKWSFRIALDSGKVLGGLTKFSLHTPEARHFTEEYFLHKLATEMGLLATDYGFVQVNVNGKNLGLYAYEEHFTNTLLARNSKPIGPIVKFDEEPFWDMVRFQKKLRKDIIIPFYQAAQVIPFQTKKIVASDRLYHQFLEAKKLMQHYQWSTLEGSKTFDAKNIGAFLALCDFANIFHTLAWHNQRLYFNPQYKKLELILFDAFQPNWPKGSKSLLTQVIQNTRPTIKSHPDHHFVKALLKDKSILEAYKNTTIYLSSDTFTNILDRLLVHAQSFDPIMQQEFPDYQFNDAHFKAQQTYQKNNLDAFVKKLNLVTFERENRPLEKNEYVLPNVNVKCFVDTVYRMSITCENYHYQAVSNLRFNFDSDSLILNKSIPAIGMKQGIPGSWSYKISKEDCKHLKTIKYQLQGRDSWYEASIYPWPK
jgi:hypothetical protein